MLSRLFQSTVLDCVIPVVELMVGEYVLPRVGCLSPLTQKSKTHLTGNNKGADSSRVQHYVHTDTEQ